MSKDKLNPDVPASKPEERLGRRLFFFKAAAVIGGAAAAVAGTTTQAEAQWCTDRDPYDPRGGGRWCRRRRYYGCTDRDPYNPRGRGRWCR